MEPKSMQKRIKNQCQNWYRKRSRKSSKIMFPGTTSDADWACQGEEKNVLFFQIVEGELQAWVHPERL